MGSVQVGVVMNKLLGTIAVLVIAGIIGAVAQTAGTFVTGTTISSSAMNAALGNKQDYPVPAGTTSAAGILQLGTSSGQAMQGNQAQTNTACEVWDSKSAVVANTFTFPTPSAWSGTITKVTTFTNGTSTPGFTAAVQINGTPVTGCSAISVSGSTTSSTTCTGANTFSGSAQISFVVSSVSGVPNQASICAEITRGVAQ